jgi:hypothetical protein
VWDAAAERAADQLNNCRQLTLRIMATEGADHFI